MPSSYIRLLDDFFRMVDTLPKDPTIAHQIASTFTPSGTWKTPSAVFQGHDQISQSGSSWEFLRTIRSLQHQVKKVYAIDASARDLMLFGVLSAETKEGQETSVHFSAKVDIDIDEQGKPRFSFFQGWSSRV